MIRRSSVGERTPPPLLWAILAAITLLPLYLFTGVFAIKSGVFRFQNNQLTDAQFTAVLAFIGTGIASVITLVGLVFTHAHNLRSAQQMTLETVVKGLDLIGKAEGGYAPKATVGGALAALVQLDHPVIAMQTLDAAWEEQAVHTSTACWLIGEVLRLGPSNQSLIEAAALLRSNAKKLAGPVDRPGFHYWPSSLYGAWPTDIPRRARIDIALAIPRLVLSRPAEWWGESIGHFVLLLDRAQVTDPDIVIRRTSAVLMGPLLETYHADEELSLAAVTGEGSISLRQIREATSKIEGGDIVGEAALLYDLLIHWLAEKAEDSQ